tara:strand:- start:2664 stop:2870 length:207 start_codon:yes stop_codon:yes gene_type:complete
MYSHCQLKYKDKPENKVGGSCPFCGIYKKEKYCGIAKGNNKLSNMTKCPYKPKKRITTLTNAYKDLFK